MNRQTRTLQILTAALALGLAAPLAFAGQPKGDQAKSTQAKGDIVDTAVAAGPFNTLAAALTAAGLVDTLKGKGPFTVFAPTDEAFAALPAGTVEDLLKPENKEKLVAVLTYHVVPGNVMAKDVVSSPKLKSVQGQELTVRVEGATDLRVAVDPEECTTAARRNGRDGRSRGRPGGQGRVGIEGGAQVVASDLQRHPLPGAVQRAVDDHGERLRPLESLPWQR